MEKKKKEFSKVLLIQESVLIWITTLVCLVLGFYCIHQGFIGSLPWLSSIIISTWTAYGVSQAFYYKKSLVENSAGGIKYETVLTEMKMTAEQAYENLENELEESLAGFDNMVSFNAMDSDDDPYKI